MDGTKAKHSLRADYRKQHLVRFRAIDRIWCRRDFICLSGQQPARHRRSLRTDDDLTHRAGMRAGAYISRPGPLRCTCSLSMCAPRTSEAIVGLPDRDGLGVSRGTGECALSTGASASTAVSVAGARKHGIRIWKLHQLVVVHMHSKFQSEKLNRAR